MADSSGNGSSIDVLTALCRRELAFVESYRRALGAPSLSEHASALSACLRSHEDRAEQLKSRLRALKAEPPTSGGLLGAVAKLLEGAAAAFGERAGILALEEEEVLGSRGYRANFSAMDPESRALIEQRLAPLQAETHRIMSDLRHQRAPGRPATEP
jgi:hypothetical protein